jgi:hypothetical protein
VGSGITWYDVLGTLPGASAAEIRRDYDSKARLLRPELLTGAPSPVVAAASRAQGILDVAWRVLGEPAQRLRYDETIGIRSSGGGLTRQENIPSEPRLDSLDFGPFGRNATALLGGLLALTEWLTPPPHQPGRIVVPDVRGLFYSVCMTVAGRMGLRVTAVRLTEHPMPVDGLVVDQSPRPLTKTRRASALTVQVWHPPSRAVR